MALDYLTADTQEVKDVLACIADAESEEEDET